MQSSSTQLLSIVKRAHQASVQLAQTSSLERTQGVTVLATAMESSLDEILEANTLDLETSREMAIPEPIINWLKLTPERLETAINILQQLAKSPNPTCRLISAAYQLESSQTYYQLMPLGTIALVYEAFPELAAIAAGMCLKTGNSLILRGCSAASNTNQTIANILYQALDSTELPRDGILAISPDSGTSIQELIVQEQYIDLVIPYGRPRLVQQIKEQATVTVLPTAMGNCYCYWSNSGELELIRKMIIDSHDSEPDAVNAIEKVLIYKNKQSLSLQSLFNSLQTKGFELRGDIDLITEFPEYLTPIKTAEWSSSYLSKTVAFRYVDDVSAAITWMNRYSSGHANSIVTESYQESRQFIQDATSALVYINTSPKFSRNPDESNAVFLGMSNQKGLRQGLISLETLTKVKQVIQG
ncbi:MAG: gamma-glutamyl-phosphate reductase [Pleurocapsa sp.]